MLASKHVVLKIERKVLGDSVLCVDICVIHRVNNTRSTIAHVPLNKFRASIIQSP